MTSNAPLKPPEEFLAGAAALGIEFESGEVERLGGYLALLFEANAQFNLTAITDERAAWTRHILDSLTLLPFVVSLLDQSNGEDAGADAEKSSLSDMIRPVTSAPTGNAARVIDVGSGGGLPGIPLAIVMPNVQFTLLEATGKKARFLQQVTQRLDLKNVVVINDRAEKIGQNHLHHREQYDLAMARAVGRLPVLLELTVPLVKIGCHVLAMKGEKAADEIAESRQALHLLHAQVVETSHSDSGTIVVIQKMRKTPRLYPRSAGEPKRVPLGTKGK